MPRMKLRIREVDEGGKGPFDKLRDRGSFYTVSELAELAVKFKEKQNIFQHLFRCKI